MNNKQPLRAIFVILLSFCLMACQTNSLYKQPGAKPEGHVKSIDGVPIYYTNLGSISARAGTTTAFSFGDNINTSQLNHYGLKVHRLFNSD